MAPLALVAVVNGATFANAPAVVNVTTFAAAASIVNGAACSCSPAVVNGDSADGKGAAEISLLLMAPKVPSNDTQILLLVFPMVPLNYQ